ncbi:MAG: endo-1,4-beta-xylanase [Microbacteriaceae bacterium]|nr:endo-1,4-beta-xylanase [Microbacteriaceae bacterium]MCL2795532.1 endo-1,4-beta-xylanase [Microbacteriaceae bacterium]
MQLASCRAEQPAHRLGDAVVTVTDATGEPLRDAEVTVAQTRHAFGFGNIGFDFIGYANGAGREGDAELAEAYTELFNWATLPFYWGRFEPERGRPDTARLRKTAEWFRSQGVALKGHPLVWHTVQPPWLLGLPLDEVERLQRERIRRDVADFAGLIDTWDAINEAVIMPVFDNGDNAITPLARARGRIPMIRMAFEEARATNPAATLLINDFDLSSAYECLIEGVLEAGIRIDAIGLQTHMHQGYWGEDTMLAMVDRFARYGLPLHLTENSLVSGHIMPADVVDLNDYRIPSWPSTDEGEARQAAELARHYSSLVGHPAVESITYWGITDAGAWLGAPIGLVRADGSRKPAHAALKALIKGDWWLPRTVLRTDAEGRFGLRGFAGDYEVGATGSSARSAICLSQQQNQSVHLTMEVEGQIQ